MTTTRGPLDLPSASCPACGAPLAAAAGVDPVACPACGRLLPVAALSELAQLTTWAEWAGARAGWLRDRLAAGDLPQDGWSVLTGAGAVTLPGREDVPAVPVRAPRPRPSVGSLLLAGGATLLVLAGIAFVAFAWDVLGPAGQVLTLYTLGGLVLLAGVRLRGRLPGTATALGVVGALLVAVSTVATRVLGPDVVGATGAAVFATGAAVVLTVVGVRLRPRMTGVGEVAAAVGAALTLGVLATAPGDDALPLGDDWAWWPALVLLAGGVALLPLAHRFGIRTWGPLAAFALFVGSLLLAGHMASLVGEDISVFVSAAVLLLLATGQVLLVRWLPGRSTVPGWTAGAVTLVAVLESVASGVALAASRPLSALSLVAASGLVAATRHRLPLALQRVGEGVVLVLVGCAVGFAVAPWTDTWATWRGLLAGLALAALLVVTAELSARTRGGDPGAGLVALAATAAGTAVWVVAVVADDAGPRDAVVRGVATTLLLAGLAVWGEVLRRRLPAWTGWVGGLAVAVAGGLALGTVDLTTAYAPELYGLALGLVAGVSGAVCWWVRRPAPTPSLVTVGPALTLLLAPSVLAVVGDATDRWWSGEDLTTAYQVRVVAVFVVGATLVAVGAWRRLAGVVVPAAAALLAVTAVQLVELGRFLPQWVSFGVAGAILVAAGARWESVRRLGREGGTWVRHLH